MNLETITLKAKQPSLSVASLAVYLLTLTYGLGAEIEIVNDDTTKRIEFAKELLHLQQEWRAGNVQALEVLHVSTNREFFGNVSSSMVRAYSNFRLVVRDPKETKMAEELIAVIDKAEVKPSGKVADLRWGCIFYTRNSELVFAVYFDRSGRKGVVNGACVDFESDSLLKWAQANFGTVFR